VARYLVTGGGGFIGSHIAEELVRRGETVRVLDNFATGRVENLVAFAEGVDLVEGDLRDPAACAEAVRDVDYVLHQAAVPSVPRSVADPVGSHEANITGTLNLLVAARDAGVRRLVFAGSSSVYGDQPGASKDESLPLNPMSPYAAAKAAGEHYCRAFSRCFGLETVCLRYFNVFGPRQDPDSPYSAVIPLFIKAMLRGDAPVIHGDGAQARDFTYVANNVRANLLAATAPIGAEGQAYNIACGAAISLLDLVAAINDALGTAITPRHVEPRVGDIRLSRADIGRARTDLGYEVGVPFKEGLRRTIAHYRGDREPAPV
jgi:nucleoside-diphosphate-sugar epimerase